MTLVPVGTVDCGVDWATITTDSHETGTQLASFASEFLYHERERGNLLRPWGMYGYQGFQCGQIATGTRLESGIVCLAGRLAQTEWRKFMPFATNASRVDLQVTYRFSTPPSKVISSIYRGVKNYQRGKKNLPEIWTVKKLNRGTTVYFGQRVSDRFGRIYDKHAQSKSDHYRDCVRFELQLNNNLAWSTINLLDHTQPAAGELNGESPEIKRVHSIIAGYFSGQGVRAEFATAGESLVTSAWSSPSSHQKLEWLRSQVAPTVKRLQSEGFEREALIALLGYARANELLGEK